MWRRPLLVAFYIAAADVQCEGAECQGIQGLCFSPKGTHF